ncbi:VirB4 family type IV secretion system protein [Robertmurraya beringensis]|uniref:VirB4 family type IV secretion system protein n=1 Tax=Robertmurraya beringensis TaxID=641660 RepID=A0ABV6KU19_9BACI
MKEPKKKKQVKSKPSKETKNKKKKQTEIEDTPDYQMDTKPSMWDIISPEGLKINSEDHGIIKQSLGTKTYFRPFYIPRDGYPRKMQTNWLYKITSSGEVDILVDIHKVGKTDAIRTLQRQITMLQSNLTFQTKRGNIDQINDLESKIRDTDLLMSEIQFSENDMYNVSTMGVLYAQSEKELNRYSEALEDEMSSSFFSLATAWGRIKKGYRSVLPFGKNELPDSLRNMDRRALSTFSPFISGSGKYMGGIPLGINKITGQLEFITSFGNEEYRPQNYNMFVVGVSGSGKSVTLKLLIARELTGANIYSRLIDPEGEFVRITKRLGGINLNISEEEDICINPLAINFTDIPLDEQDEELELLEDTDEREIVEKEGKKYVRFVPLREKMNDILDFFDIIARGKNSEDRGLDVFERNYLEEAIQYIFTHKLKLTSHPDSLFSNEVVKVDNQLIQSRVRKPEPTISDVYDYLKEHYEKEDKALRLLAAIKPFLRTGSKPIFDGQTYLGKGVNQSLHDARLVNFNISQMEEGFLRPIAYHVILNYLWEHFVKNLDNATKKKFVYADEAWTLIDSDQTVSFLEKMARRARKRNAGLRLASQDFVRFVTNSKARGILQNTHAYLFLQQNKIDLKAIQENFDLSAGELNILFGNPDKGEGILRMGKSSVWLQTNPSKEELFFIESNQAVYEEQMQRRKQLEQR